MPKPTLTEMVRELDRSVVTLEERVKSIRTLDETDRLLTSELAQLKLAFAQELAQLKADLAATREKALTNEKAVDQINQRRWALVIAIVSAVLGGFLTFVIQFSLRALPK
jgi:hypothetical protein